MRIEKLLSALIEKYGREITLLSSPLHEAVTGRGILQSMPMGTKEMQKLPTRFGISREERFLLLAEKSLPMEEMEGGMVLCDGAEYMLSSVQLVWFGRQKSHWRAVLTIRGEEIS